MPRTLSPADLAQLDAELATRQPPADTAPADLILALVQQLLAHQDSDATVGIQSLLREIEAREPGALARMQASLQRRRIRRELGAHAARQ